MQLYDYGIKGSGSDLTSRPYHHYALVASISSCQKTKRVASSSSVVGTSGLVCWFPNL